MPALGKSYISPVIGCALWLMWGIQPTWGAPSRGEDGLRAVLAEKYGVSIRAPQAWNLIRWHQGSTAFELSLPQESGSFFGRFRCEVSAAPVNLAEYQKQHDAEDRAAELPEDQLPSDAERSKQFLRQNPTRELVRSVVEAFEVPDLQNETAKIRLERLTSVWRYTSDNNRQSFVMRCAVISHGHLYEFYLSSDEAHFEAYRIDSVGLLARAQFTPPETGLEALAGGYWLQRNFRFALWLPEGWRPAFSPREKVLFYAAGEVRHPFSDYLSVMAAPVKDLDLKALQETLPKELAAADPQAKIARCEVIAVGPLVVLETVLHTKHHGLSITIVDRRFVTDRYHYDLRYTFLSSSFDQLAPLLFRSLNSFREVPAADKGVF